jgi:hypothetical protein
MRLDDEKHGLDHDSYVRIDERPERGFLVTASRRRYRWMPERLRDGAPAARREAPYLSSFGRGYSSFRPVFAAEGACTVRGTPARAGVVPPSTMETRHVPFSKRDRVLGDRVIATDVTANIIDDSQKAIGRASPPAAGAPSRRPTPSR